MPASTPAPARPGRRFIRRHRRLRASLTQLLFVAAGLVAGIFVPKITVSPMVSSGRIVDVLFTASATVIGLVTVIYSLLFLVPVIWAEVGADAKPDQPPEPAQPDARVS